MRKIVLIVFLALLGIMIPIRAQEDAQNNVTISVTVPEILEGTYQVAIDEFEAANPGITVEVVKLPGLTSNISRSDDIEAYLDKLLEYVSSADVLLLDSSVGTEITRAGYILDLNPLISTDSSFNPADFHTSMLRSFEWDGGLWAIPVTGEVSILYYVPEKFDRVGINYPTDAWSLDDLEAALEALGEFDEDGNILSSEFFDLTYGNAALFLSLLDDNVYDDAAFPSVPDYENPALEAILEKWVKLQKSGLLSPPSGEVDPFNSDIAIQLGGRFLGEQIEGLSERRGALLPGGRAGLDVQGFGVSAGTESPEAAYALANFLSQHPNVVSSSFLGSPARPALEGVVPEDVEIFMIFDEELSPQIKETLALAVERALSMNEMLFARGIAAAVQEMQKEDGVDARTALDKAKDDILADLQAADARRGVNNIVIQHRGTQTVAEGEIALKFGVGAFVSPIPNQDAWQQIAEDFAADDLQVGLVDLNTEFPGLLDQMAEQYDCFYLPSNAVQTADLRKLLNIDPLMAADSELDPADFVGNILPEVQVNGQTWALPMNLQPQVMRYNVDLFTQAGVPLPEAGWTIPEFEDALRRVKNVLVDPKTSPFQPQDFEGNAMLNLIAAYGAIPIDTRVDPPAINFTDPATIDAIRQVLDLAKEGLIQYDGVITSGNVSTIVIDGSSPAALYTETLSGHGFGGGFIIMEEGDEDLFNFPENIDPYMLFPSGTQYSVVAFDLGAAYISANTQNAEACYRFIKSLSQSPTLFQSMPARQSVINDPLLEQSQNANLIAIYRRIAEVMQQPQTVLLTSQDEGASFILTFWLNRAFDRYILKDADLETELQDAEVFTKAFAQCTENIEPLQSFEDLAAVEDFFGQVTECATSIDPSAEEFF